MPKKITLSSKLVSLLIDEAAKSIKKSIRKPKPPKDNRFNDNHIF